jgi:hypothetical protein
LRRAKAFEISKKVVWEAWKRVKGNHEEAGVDEESIADFVECGEVILENCSAKLRENPEEKRVYLGE